jgi:hypothetical protein
MKKIKKIATGLMLIVFAGCTSTLPTATTAAPAPVGVSFQVFYDDLSPYGSWVSYPEYGYAWIPRVAPGFRPYFSSGQWVMTDFGWTWVSFYDWGWAPFHYGSWQYDPFYGWLWVPGYNWAPAWVTWGYYDGYYGWAPLAPGVSFSVGYYPPIDYWVFVPPTYITTAGWNNNYYVASQHRIAFDNNTTLNNVRGINVVNNTGTYNGQRFSAGPPKTEFERTANTKVNVVPIKDMNSPGKARVSGDALSMYRPAVERDRVSAKPSQVTPLEKMKLSDERNIRGTEAGRAKGRIERTPAPMEKQRMPERQVVPQERNTTVQPNTQERGVRNRNENTQPQQKVRQPVVRPNSNPEPAQAPQRNVERERVQQQPVERPKQSPTERIQRPQQREPQVAPERREQIERPLPQPRYQPQPMPQQNRGHNNPK